MEPTPPSESPSGGRADLPFPPTAVLDALDVPLLLVDAEGRVRWANAGAQARLGVVGGAGPGGAAPALADVVRFRGVDGADDPDPDEPLAALRAGRPWGRPEVRVDTPAGESFPAAVMLAPVRPGDGLGGGVLTLRDRSARRRVESALREARNEAEAARGAERAKTEFLANMTHELRTPLNGIIGMTELLLESGLPGEPRGYARTVRDSAHHLLSLINGLLDFSKIEADRMEIERIPFDLRKVVEGVGSLLAPAARDKGLELIVRYAPDAPRRVEGDPGRIRQILLNLAGNAVKFTDTGHVLIEATATRPRAGHADFVLTVEDTGIGIPGKRLSAIFEKFTQVDASTTRHYGGTGLGLAISRRLAELMGGTLRAESREGEGSRFRLEVALPVVRRTPSSLVAGPLLGVRALVVDAAEPTRETLAGQLRHWGMEVEAVDSGARAYRRLHAAAEAGTPHRIVILGANLEGTSPEAFGALVKGDGQLAATDLVFLATIGEQGQAKRLEEAGFSGFLVKPVRTESLREMLSVIIGERSAGRDPGLVTKHTLADSSESMPRPVGVGPPARNVRLPEADDTTTGAALSAAEAWHRAEPDGRDGGPDVGPTVLVVDDHPVNRKVARRLLERLGCTVDEADAGEAALARLRERAYAVVFLDCRMPGMDGFETAQRQRARERAEKAAPTPIVAMTANDTDEDRQACLEAGMDDFLAKPVTKDGVRRALDRWTRETTLRRPGV